MLDKMKQDGDLEKSVGILVDALGDIPDPKDLKEIMKRDNRDEDKRRILWAVAIGDGVELPGWVQTLGILNARGRDRDSMRPHYAHTPIVHRNPFGSEDFDSEDPYSMAAKIEAWVPSATNGPNQPSVLGIRSELEDAVKRTPDKWAEDPVRMVKMLKHPTYVAGYFRGLARAGDKIGAHAEGLIRSVLFVRGHPWSADELGSSRLDYDHDWQNTDAAGLDLIGVLANMNAEMSAETVSEAWGAVLEAVTNRTQGIYR